MNSNIVDYRVMPAEWESHHAILMAWPDTHTDWVDMLPEVRECYSNIIRALLPYQRVILIANENPFEPHPNLSILNVPYNDTWTRDYGPITVRISEGTYKYLDFAFNAWGLKFAADKDNGVTRKLCETLDLDRENHLGFILEGGSIESDGAGKMLTTACCLESPNRNGDLSRDEIEAYLRKSLGVKHFYWLECEPLEGDDTDAHIDTIARLAPNDTILYTKCVDPANVNFDNLSNIERQLTQFRTPAGKPFNLVALPCPDDIDGNPATYANYLVTPEIVLVPTYGQPEHDPRALNAVREVFAPRKVVGIDCRALIKQHGSLHCATMQIPFNV